MGRVTELELEKFGVDVVKFSVVIIVDGFVVVVGFGVKNSG